MLLQTRTSQLSSGYYFVNLLREAEIGFINLVGLVGGIFLLRSKNNKKSGILFLTWWLSCWGFAIYSFGSLGSFIERPALFSLIPLALLVPLFLSTMKNQRRLKLFVIISILMVGVSCFCLPITRNANDVFETPPVASLSAANFAIAKTSQQIIVGGHNLFVSIIYAGPNLSLEALYNQLYEKNIPTYYLFDNTYIMNNDSLIVFDQPAYAYAVNYGNAAGYQQIQNFSNSEFSCIYDNAEATIYINRLGNFNATSEISG